MHSLTSTSGAHYFSALSMTSSFMAFNDFHQSHYSHIRTSLSFPKNHNTVSKTPFPRTHYSAIHFHIIASLPVKCLLDADCGHGN